MFSLTYGVGGGVAVCGLFPFGGAFDVAGAIPGDEFVAVAAVFVIHDHLAKGGAAHGAILRENWPRWAA